MTEAFSPDEIGPWSEIKLEIIEKYGSAYTKAFGQHRLKKYYIDGFSGSGLHLSKGTKQPIEGSPSRALRVAPPFDGYYFIDLNSDKTDYLKRQCEGRSGVTIYTGDSNEHLLRDVLPGIRYERYTRALCLLDPYGLHLDWRVIETAGKSGAIDMFLNFPVMDMNMNALLWKPEKATAQGVERMNRFWGDESWRDAAYVKSDPDLFGDTSLVKQPNEAIVKAFQERLRTVAGFKYVPNPLPMKNRTNAVVYYLFFAAANATAGTIITDIFKRYR